MVGPRNTDTHRLRGVIQRLLKSNPAAMGQPDVPAGFGGAIPATIPSGQHSFGGNYAAKYLEEFDANGAKQVEAKAEGLLGDAYSEMKQNDKAIEHYKKAGTLFPEDAFLSSEYLFRAGMLYELAGKNKEAIEIYVQIKEKFPRTEKGYNIDKYLARLGETKL